MSDASSIRKASSLESQSQNGAPFYKSAIRFCNNQAYVNTGSQWVGLGNTVVNTTFPVVAEDVSQNIFVADKKYNILSVSEVHSTAGSDNGTVSVDVQACNSTQAPGSGTTVLASVFNLKSTANTVVNKTLATTLPTLAVGDRLAVNFTGTPTSLAGVVITVVLQPV